MRSCSTRVAPWVLIALGAACLPQNPGGSGGSSTTDAADSTGDDTDDGPAAGGELLGCPATGCTMVLVAQTLDDRVEVFVPDHPEAIYRGGVDLDLKPNECAGCGPGDNGAGRLDEPFGLARSGGFLHVLVGHYPTRQEGSLVSFPLSFFEGYTQGSLVPTADFFAGSQFTAPVIGRSLGQVEPIFLHEHTSGRIIVGVFNNDLFAGEDTWTQAGRLLVFDATDPSGEVGEVTLDALGGGDVCQGASQVLDAGNDELAIACDGNEAIAFVDASSVGAGSVADAATSLGTGSLCTLPGAMPGKRVRYLAPDGSGGVVVGEGPTPLDIQANARLWRLGSDCSVLGNADLSSVGSAGDWQLGEIVQLPASTPTWLFASGSALPAGLRGVFAAYVDNGTLAFCDAPVAGLDASWDDGNAGVLEPFALDVTSDGSQFAVGAGPLSADPAGIGYGKVLWGSLSGADPCSLSATVVDLTDGGPGHAPAPIAADVSTYRRGPSVAV
ncbi:MAG: hypothetical protein K0V04_28780, partial [Deltaproteobacteria bacterium]|nr:hypothetical protein [Deltaproteobacteria bacterium]